MTKSLRLLQMLPAIYREDAYLGSFLAPFEALLFGLDDPEQPPGATRPPLEKQIDDLARIFRAQDTPADFLPWLAGWIGLTLRADFTEQQKRDFLENTVVRYRRRGTKANLLDLLRVFTAGVPTVTEDPVQPFRFSVDFGLLEWSRYGGAVKDYPAYVEHQTAMARAVIELEKPAHAAFRLNPVFPTMRISPKTATPNAPTEGYFSTVGVDTLLGAPTLDPGHPPTITIASTPNPVALGQYTILTWQSTNSTDTTASGSWSGHVPSEGTQVVTPTAQGDARYTITAAGFAADGKTPVTVAATTVVKVGPPLPVVRITAAPATFFVGKSTTLTWSMDNATATTASGGWTGTRAVSGTETVTPSAAGALSFKLTGTGPGGSMSNAVSVTVKPLPPPPTVSLYFQPNPVQQGQNATLYWSQSGATGPGTASGSWSGSKDAAGGQLTQQMNTIGGFSYSLTFSNEGGSTTAQAGINVTYRVPTVVISVSQNPTVQGRAVVVTWSSTDAGGADAAGPFPGWAGPKSVSGSFTANNVPAGTTNFTITVTGVGGTATATVALTARSTAGY